MKIPQVASTTRSGRRPRDQKERPSAIACRPSECPDLRAGVRRFTTRGTSAYRFVPPGTAAWAVVCLGWADPWLAHGMGTTTDQGSHDTRRNP